MIMTALRETTTLFNLDSLFGEILIDNMKTFLNI